MSTATLPISSVNSVGWPSGTVLEHYDPEAERVSNRIDEALKQEAARRKEAKKREVRVLLLGQADSGKSTLHKQFQLYYASHTLERERPSWRPAVYLNIVRATRTIMEGLENEVALSIGNPPDPDFPITKGIQDEVTRMASTLRPLIDAESILSSELNGGLSGRASSYARSGWQTLISPRRNSSDTLADLTPGARRVVELLREMRESVETLRRYPLVASLLARRKMRIEESAPYFLNNVNRVCHPDYLPTTEDILNVRMKTLGVVEYSLSVQQAGRDYTWRMYDVGGARSQRHAWIPYFDDTTAILFLAPISAFDQQLEEDPKVNRLEDSLQLFTAICSSRLLEKATLILFLNKVDLLKQKLQNGRKVRKYIPSYGNRPNTYEEASEYFRAHFCQVQRKKDKTHRALFVHFTSMLDTKATHLVVADVANAIVRKHIEELGLA
ncbi:putative G protein alpha subunit [Lyophyllum shimeji]|uniref:G protein alpha subunit n=1 Tax=Lyophyllum shimeji TaxID=47721 RepID=A0A9P3PK81_LYOSH|nr:putative G protein alpha subunit [Lyophyllum shimeji]